MKPLEELLVFSDLHAHNFKYGSKRVGYKDRPGTYNTRLLDTLDVLDEIKDYAIANGIKTLLFGGDLFHRRQVYHTDVFNLIFDKFVEMSDLGLGILMIPGNHDCADRTGQVHALQPFEAIPNVWVGDSQAVMVTNECNIVCVPYTPDLATAQANLVYAGETAKAANNPTILLAHLGMRGARVGSDYILVSEGDIKVADVPHQDFTACFFGHYHEHQQLFENGWYIGATHEHNWGDSGGKRGFLHVRVFPDKVDFKHIETKAPKFVVVNGTSAVPRDVDFVRVLVDSVSLSIRRRLETQLGRTDIDIQQRLDKPEIMLTLEASKLDPESAMAAWIEANPPDDLDAKVVLDEGRSFLRTTLGSDL